MFGFQAVAGFLTTSPLGGKTLVLAPNPPTQGLWLGGAAGLVAAGGGTMLAVRRRRSS
ncbi:hypothetical protein [Streptomyces mirabilis]